MTSSGGWRFPSDIITYNDFSLSSGREELTCNVHSVGGSCKESLLLVKVALKELLNVFMIFYYLDLTLMLVVSRRPVSVRCKVATE